MSQFTGIRSDVQDGRGMGDAIPAAAHGLANMKARALGVGARSSWLKMRLLPGSGTATMGGPRQ
ncbi:MAG: hypothetical protein ACYC0T_04225 [Ramlibacter sp.]